VGASAFLLAKASVFFQYHGIQRGLKGLAIARSDEV